MGAERYTGDAPNSDGSQGTKNTLSQAAGTPVPGSG